MTLEPKDSRESKIYYQNRLYGIADIYWAIITISGIAMIVVFGTSLLNENLVDLIASVILLILFVIRVLMYQVRKLNWKLFGVHLIALNFAIIILTKVRNIFES